MRNLMVLFLLAGALFLPGVLFAESMYTVSLGRSASREAALHRAGEFAGAADLWLQPVDGEALELRAGIFPGQQYAALLLEQLSAKLPPGSGSPALTEVERLPGPEQWIPRQVRVSLRDLGYVRPVLLQGVQPFFSCSFPWHSRNLLSGSALHLQFEASAVLQTDASLTIMVEGRPLKTVRVEALAKPVIVALDGLDHQTIGATLEVEIVGSLRASEDYCADMRDRSLWVTLGQQSGLQVQQRPPESVVQFFQAPAASFTLLPQAQTLPVVEAMGQVAALVGSLARNERSRLAFHRFAVAGSNIFLGDFPDDVRLLGSNLYISPNGASLLANNWFPGLLLTRFSGERRADAPASLERSLNFQELGLPSRTNRGGGDLAFPLRFTLAQLGGWPGEDLLCTLHFAHTPVAERNQAFLKVFLNTALIESRDIAGPGGRQSLVFRLPARFLQADNTVEFVFSSFQHTADCMGDYPDLTVSVLEDSFLGVSGFASNPPLTLSSFPGVFQGQGALVVERPEPAFYEPVIRLAEALAFRQRGVPQLKAQEPAEFAGSGAAFGLMALGPEKGREHKPLLDLSEKRIEIRNPLNQSLLLGLDNTEKVVVVQTFFSPRGVPVLLYQTRLGEAAVPQEAMSAILASNTRGNVGIIAGDSQWSAVEVGEKFRIIYPDQRSLMYYWVQYRLLFFIAAGALALMFFYYLYHHLAKEK